MLTVMAAMATPRSACQIEIAPEPGDAADRWQGVAALCACIDCFYQKFY